MSGAATDLEYCLNVIILIYCYIKKHGELGILLWKASLVES